MSFGDIYDTFGFPRDIKGNPLIQKRQEHMVMYRSRGRSPQVDFYIYIYY